MKRLGPSIGGYGFESSPLDEFHLMLLLKDVRVILDVG